jgi:cytochrome b561/polyisoprenoid-binding protein YceI
MLLRRRDGGRSPIDAAQVRYSTGAIALHWLLALAMAFQIALGFSMPHAGPHSFVPMQLHKSVGIAILLLTLARLGWRIVRRPPESVEGGWTAVLARIVHWAFYAVLVLGPLTGWIIVSTARLHVPTLLFGLVPWPHLPLPSTLNEPTEEVHEALAWIALVLFGLHVAGALRHQFVLRDPVIRRIAPAGSVAAAMGLLVATVVIYFAVGTYVSQKYLVPAMAEFRAARAQRAATPAAPPAPATATAAQDVLPAPEASSTDAAEPAGPAPEWTISGGKRLAFAVDNGGTAVRGQFRDWSGSIKMDPDHPESADIRITIRLSGASVGDATQDAMLQGADFLASASNPTASWRSTRVTQTAPGHYRADGTLTIRGKSRPQAITFTLTGKDRTRHVVGNATIDRTAFGIGSGEAAEALARSVALDFAFDARAKAP